MCASCGCNAPYDDHGDSRNITMQDLDQAAQAAGTARERVVENIAQTARSESESGARSAQAGRGDFYQSSREKEAGQQPVEESSERSQVSGSEWQEGMPMGDLQSRNIENPQANP